MATLEEKLCPVCFQEAMEGGKCQNCGYVLDKASVGENHLKPFSILNTKYLLGKVSDRAALALPIWRRICRMDHAAVSKSIFRLI